MKRILLMLLTLSLCLSACSAPAVKTAERAEAEQKTAEEKTSEEEPMEKTEVKETEEGKTEEKAPVAPLEGYTPFIYSLADHVGGYKIFGRSFVNGFGLNVDFAANGFELEGEFGGEVLLEYSADVKTYFQVYIDGQPGERIVTGVGRSRTVRIADAVPNGVHTLRIVRDTDATKAGELMALKAVYLIGKEDSIHATPESDVYIEFVGDSITAGKYTEMQYVEGDAIHKATNSYAYRTAVELGADYSVVARGGCGFFRVSTCPKTMNQLYPYQNGFAKEPVSYQPARRADVVVLALGTNDSASNVKESFENGTVPFATFEDALKDQIRLIREMHGQDVKIVLLYGMMSTTWEKEFKATAESEGTYLLKVTKNRAGGKNHPSTAGHTVMATELVRYLRSEVLK
ncbi:MAG: hypothetical protein IKC69_04600 [Clostridia bacterium]|nr:hypothetical protein [Clostridia bacterium]